MTNDEPTVRPLRFAALTDKGMVRAENQDAVRAGPVAGTTYLLAVADGVGGGRGGAWASTTAVAALFEAAKENAGRLSPAETLRNAFVHANEAVHKAAQQDPSLNGAATTLVAVLVEGAAFTWGNVGDSRLYLVAGEGCSQLSRDHSLVADEVAAGRMSKAEAEVSQFRNVITRSIGPEAHVEPDIEGPQAFSEDQVLLLCSDGLHGPVRQEELAGYAGTTDLQSAAKDLVALANQRGGRDNISVVLARL